MADIRSPVLLYLKGGLMLGTGLLAAGLLLVEHHDLRTIVLLLLAIWGFCRAYYFAFYVVEHYIDPGYRYAGLMSFLLHSRRRWRQPADSSARRQAETPAAGRAEVSAPVHSAEKSGGPMVE